MNNSTSTDRGEGQWWDTSGSGNWVFIYNNDCSASSNIFELKEELKSSLYLDDWPMPGDPPPPWLPPSTHEHRRGRWLPPRCLLKSLVVRRDFPKECLTG